MSHYLKKIKQDSLLEKSFNYIIENNTASKLPYHNTRHLIKVFNTAINIANDFGDFLDNTNKVELGIAALFHDMNHSGGELVDQENIKIANFEFLLFFDTLNKEEQKKIKPEHIMELIQYTVYPQVKNPSFVLEQILIDSDLIQCYDIDWFLYAIKGLSEERGVNISQALQDQTNFINNIKFYTEYAQRIHDKKKDKYLKRLKYLKTIFN